MVSGCLFGLNIAEESEVRRLRHIGKVIDHVLDLETPSRPDFRNLRPRLCNSQHRLTRGGRVLKCQLEAGRASRKERPQTSPTPNPYSYIFVFHGLVVTTSIQTTL